MKKYSKEEWRKMQDEKKDKLFNRVNDIINHFQNAPENIIEYLKFNAKFHQYSSNNTILIYEQNHMARFCASYKTFKDMGYQVQKGQTGMKILVPQLLTLWYDEKLQEWKKLSESTKEEKEKVKNNEVKTKRITMFGVGTVFDIGQTDCPTSDYPKLFDVGFASETHSRLYAAVVHYAESKGIAVEEQFFPSITQRGYYSRDNNLIAISDKLEDSMKLSVITHELSHALMHSNPEAAELPMEQKEIEADSLSLMLRDHLGITEIEDVRQNHLQAAYKSYLNWAHDNKENIHCPELSEILDNVHNTYIDIIHDFDKSINHYLELHQKSFNVNNNLPSQTEITVVAAYENAYSVSADKSQTVWFGDLGLYEASAHYNPDTFQSVLNTAMQKLGIKENDLQSRFFNDYNQLKTYFSTLSSAEQENTQFENQLEEYLNGTFKPHEYITVCSTPLSLQICDVPNLQVTVNQSTIQKIISNDNKKIPHAHDIDIEDLKQLPNQLRNPVMILKGSKPDSLVLITDITDNQDKTIIISLDINKPGFNQSVNKITSMYGKDNIANYLSNQIQSGNLIAQNTEKSQQLLSITGLQSSETTNVIDYTDSICYSADFVKMPDDKILENNHSKLKDLLIKNNESPAAVLSDNHLLTWYSFSSQINNPEEIKTILKNLFENEMKIVSIQPSSDGYQITQLDENYTLRPIDSVLYKSEQEAFQSALANDTISKVTSPDCMLQAAVNKSLNDVLISDNLKYPHIKIEWSENTAINYEDRLSLSSAEKLFSEQSTINQNNGTFEETKFSFFLDNKNVFQFNISIGENNSSILEYINQQIRNMSADISENQSLKSLTNYLHEKGFIEERTFADDFNFLEL
ncbi:MAG: ssDNA-binding domain-containing protein [Eubacterium sp.]